MTVKLELKSNNLQIHDQRGKVRHLRRNEERATKKCALMTIHFTLWLDTKLLAISITKDRMSRGECEVRGIPYHCSLAGSIAPNLFGGKSGITKYCESYPWQREIPE